MEELQTDTLSDYGKNQRQENADLDPTRENENGCAAPLLNGCEEIDDPLDLMDHCDNVSITSNSDVWKGSDSEEESFEKKENSTENVEANKENDKTINDIGVINKQVDFEEEIDKVVANKSNDSIKSDDLDEQTNEAAVQDHKSQHCEKDVNKAVKTKKNECDETKKTEEQDVGGSSVIESEEPMETQLCKKIDSIEGKEEHENEKQAEKTIDSLKEKDINTTKEVVNGEAEKAEKNSVEGNASPKESSIEVLDDKDPLAPEDEHKDSSEGRPPNRDTDDDCQMEYDADDDDDFDPSLLCPEVSMAVDDCPVVMTNGPMPDDPGRESPLPYEPLFSTFVDEVTGAEVSFNLTSEEQELRKRMYGPTNRVQFTRIHCTACNVHLGSALEGQNNRFVHPLLKVLICKECYHFYTSGEFEKDEDGSELYCRWCGQGGQVLCCSKCEFVFCKRCIRTNFGRTKMLEIQDFDSWDCFRCNPSQIITQRVSCHEFFEYIRREMSRAATINSSEVWSKDHTRCCILRKRGAEDEGEVKKTKKRKGCDPDYNPLVEKVESSLQSPSTSASVPVTVAKGITVPKPINVVPRFTFNKTNDNDIEFVRQIPAPRVTIGLTPRPTYRTILPSHIRPVLQATPTLVRISSQPVPANSRILGNILQSRPMHNPSLMKHEWFEKTVRAAARVNSHLSYTLTQLNKAQSQAGSVEELAVVHNKLQEILSSSINSLIQIRKNLRTEFIAGIKTVRLPSKKIETPEASNDDDVIFVSAPPTLSLPSTSQARTLASDPLIIIDKSNTSILIGNSSLTSSTELPKGYLKVKSVMELQNVPSECITIPDDPLPPKLNEESGEAKESEGSGEAKESEGSGEVKESEASEDTLCNGASKNEEVSKDPEKVNSSETTTEIIDLSEVTNENSFNKESENSKHTEPDASTTSVRRLTRRSKNMIIYNVKSELTAEVKRMMSVKVHLQRDNLEELQKTVAVKTE